MIKIKISESLKASITQLVDSRLVESKDLVEELENSLTLGYLTSKQFEELTSVIKVKNQAPLCTSFHDIQIQVPTSISIDSDDVVNICSFDCYTKLMYCLATKTTRNSKRISTSTTRGKRL